MKKPQLNFIIILVLFLLIAVSPIVDIGVSQLFYNHGQFYLRTGALGWLITHGIASALVLCGTAIFAIWLAGKRHWWHIQELDTRIMLLTTGTMVLGPGLIVNALFKTFWGRARPYDVSELGGTKLFTAPMVISNQCDLDCSFMSGHTAIGFWALSLALLAPRRYRKAVVTVVFLLASLYGLARIAQGYHFVSDVAFSAVVVTSLVLWMHHQLFPEEYK